MKYLMFLFLVGCSSVFIEAPKEPELEECSIISKSLESYISETVSPVPFNGTMETTMWTEKPWNWEQFTGSIYLLGVEGEIDWINHGVLIVDYLSLAIWDGEVWKVSSSIDIYPHIIESEYALGFKAKVKGKGIKPAARQDIYLTVDIALCGEGFDLIRGD